jgi:hypothetical protein
METLLQMRERIMTLALKKHKTVRSAAKALGINERTLHTFKEKLKKEKE